MIAATAFLLTVLITVDQQVPCQPEDYGMKLKTPGVYERVMVPRSKRGEIDCTRQRRTQEEWTDLPERGGRYLRTIRELVE